MAGKSSIEWCEHTWNPIVGCSVLTPGCTNCYAMKMAARIEAMNHSVNGSTGGVKHYLGTTKKVNDNSVWTGKLALAPDDILLEPLRRKKPTTYFVNSMGDLFHEDIPDEWIDKVFAVMALAPQHTFQVLTKRAERMRDYFDRDDRDYAIGAALGNMLDGNWIWSEGKKFRPAIESLISAAHGEAEQEGEYPVELLPLPNVWLGVSTERQQEADARIPHLLQTPAAVRFISAEPLLGPIDLTRIFDRSNEHSINALAGRRYMDPRDFEGSQEGKLDWVIVGGESGSNARPMHPAWARSLRQQCAAAGVAFFFKQWGEFAPCERINVSKVHALCGLMSATPHVERDWARALAFLQKVKGVDDAATLARVGKKAAGRLLDGKEHNAMPEVAA